MLTIRFFTNSEYVIHIRPKVSEILDQMQVGYDKRVRPDYGGEANYLPTH